jgi:hypothetical protein
MFEISATAVYLTFSLLLLLLFEQLVNNWRKTGADGKEIL